MKEFVLRIKGARRLSPTITVDGRKVKLKKNEFGTLETKIQTDSNNIEICVYKFLEIASPLWFIMSILFYIISIFGILDPIKEKQAVLVDCKFIVDVSQLTNGKIEFAVNNFTKEKEGRALEISGDCPVKELSNYYYEDAKLQKRIKILKFVKPVVLLACVILLVLLMQSAIFFY